MITFGIEGMMIPKPMLSMNTDSRTKVSAARDEGMGPRILRHMSGPVLACGDADCIQFRTRDVAVHMDRTDALPPEIELAQLLQRCAARDSAAFRALYD